MVQTIYGLLAIMLTMLLSLNLFRITSGAEQRMVLNEMATQVNGIGVDIMEHVGNRWFDENTSEAGITAADFPLVTAPAQLTAEGSTEWGGCTDFYANTCDDIDDFHGMTLQRSVEGLPYTASITVRYVNPDAPDTPTGSPSYAKEVIVTIQSPYLKLGDNPLTVTLSRVFAYDRITQTP